MIIKINGQEITPVISTTVEEEIIVIGRGSNKKLRRIATMFWSISATFMVKSQALAASATGSGQLWEQMKPLLYFFQDMAMFAGTLAIIAGIILLVFKRRWGIATIKTTAFAVAGIFLVPSAVLLLAILGMFLDDSLTTVLNGIREARMVGGN